MLTSHNELFVSPDRITIEVNSRVLAGARECDVITTCKENLISEYGESECYGTSLGAYSHYIDLISLDVCGAEDLSTLSGATVKIRLPRKEIIFSSCKTYKVKTKIAGGRECVSEVCMLSPHKTVREV
ncbi:MAG: hypothetical protein IKY44_03215 [Clostridia bacterium]|nr:hypothetical protein [Clostridia bacterium]